MRRWWRRQFRDVFSIVCDTSPFRTSWNFREVVFQRRGLVWARCMARSWVLEHRFGQAVIYVGWIEDEKG